MAGTCNTCLYFTRATNWRGKPGNTGICRVGPRMPAATGLLLGSYTWEFPSMGIDDWCGCWETNHPSPEPGEAP